MRRNRARNIFLALALSGIFLLSLAAAQPVMADDCWACLRLVIPDPDGGGSFVDYACLGFGKATGCAEVGTGCVELFPGQCYETY